MQILPSQPELSAAENRAKLALMLRQKARLSRSFPLSYAQERLWFLDQLEPGNPFYNVSKAVRLSGAVDVDALERTLTQLTYRHEVLRTHFRLEDDQPMQIISAPEPFVLQVEDLSALAAEQREVEARRISVEEANRAFDLSRGPLLRALLIKLRDDDYLVVLSMHHIIADGWSMSVLVREISTIYQAFVAGKPSPLHQPVIQYADYAQWQKDRAPMLEKDLEYWREQLAGAPQLFSLPTDRPRPPIQTFRGANCSFRLSTELSSQLREMCGRESVTMFMLLLAAFKVLLYRYTGQTDVVIGTDISGRQRKELESLLGFFVNQLVLRTKVDGRWTFTQLVRAVREVCVGGYGHQEVPFERVVDEMNVERSLSYGPLFQVSFTLSNAPRQSLELRDVQLKSFDLKDETAKTDLTLAMVEVGDQFGGEFEYNTDLFDATTIDRVSRHFQNLLAAIVRTPEEQIARLPLLDEAEVQQQVIEWNDTAVEYPSELCLHELVEASVARTPDAVAISCGDEVLTYAELNRRAEALAGYLRGRGVGCEDRVALLFERSPQLLVAILAVLKSGGAYVPLDPTYPAQRLEWMIADADVKLLVTERELMERVLGADCEIHTAVVYVQTVGVALCGHPSSPNRPMEATEGRPPKVDVNNQVFGSGVMSENAAYVIYTSGSTGVPKASIITHAAAVNFTLAMRGELSLTQSDRMLQFASPSFDVFVEEVFPAWATGAAVVVMDAEEAATATEARGLSAVITRNEVTGCELPAAFWHQWSSELNETPASLRFVMLGCDKPSPAWLADWQRFNVPLVIVFGLTETTITSTLYRYVGGDAFDRPTIGRPVANTQTYILDAEMQPTPTGVTGELYIGGSGVARGYCNQPAITAERFIPNPFSTRPGERVYRTGDTARYFADGTIEFLGRADDQVKIRGFRVEPEEIEVALSTHTSVKANAVSVREDVAGEKRLVAYVVCHDGPTPTASDLRQHLKARLPEYMLPSAYVILDALPVTSNGKIDRSALPKPDDSRPELDQAYAAPRTQVEELLAAIWSEVLSVNQIGIHDNFFELGGHSLLATKLNSRIGKSFNIELPLRTIFELPTIAQLAQQVERALSEAHTAQFPPLEPVPRDAHAPLSFAQGRLWFLDQLEPGNPFYNISTGVRLKGKLDRAALERTLTDIRRRHEGLRTIFPVDDGTPVQVVLPAEPFRLSVTDLSWIADADLVTEVGRVMREEAERPFDLSQGPLMRVMLLKLRPDDHVVLLSMHHIIADEWSMEMLSKEVGALYAAYTNGEPSPLEELPIQYADFACWQRALAETPLFEQQLSYWRAQLAGAPQLLSLPTDRPRPPIQTFRGANFGFRLSPELSEELRELSRHESVTLFMLLLAAFKVLLYRYTGQRDVVIGTDISGRERKELEGLIGFFVNQLVLRTTVEPGWSFRQLVRAVREVCLGAYGHQEVPFERVVDEMNVERSLSYGPLFQVSFTLSNAERQPLNLPGLSVGSAGGDLSIARYDLTLMMRNMTDVIAGAFEYNTDLFDATTIDRVSRHFQNLLAAIVRMPEEQITRLPLLDEAEVQQQVIEWNDTAVEYPSELCLHELVETSVARTPDAVAISCGDEVLTYAELNRRAEVLAGYLRGRGVGCEDRVALLFERSPQLLVAILAVLKSGGAYVPLDPTYPAQRLEWMIADADVKLLVTERELMERVFGAGCEIHTAVVYMETVGVALCGHPSMADRPMEATEDRPYKVDVNNQVGSGVMSENAAYVIYTSGSTGVPKASIITHAAAVNFTLAMRGELSLRQSDRMLQFASPSFDVFVEEVFPAWAAGAAVVVMDVEEAATATESRGLSSVITRNDVTGCELPTAYWHQWSSEVEKQHIPSSLKFVIIGGENALRERVEAWRKCDIPLLNAYGLTEVAVTSIVYTLSSDVELTQWAEFPIGRPISNTNVYILDAEMQPLPAGVIGDLYVGGTGLGRGYHNRPDLTAERFIPHPFSDRPGERVYYTGDLARYLPDGNIENIGRRDFQVKVRGFRIELGEIEAALAQYAGVTECVVVADHTRGSDKRLIAYLAAGVEDRPTPGQLRAYLLDKLPDYMVPSVFVFMDALPLSPNGKLDRKSLPAISHSALDLGHEYVAPESATEIELARLWTTILRLETIGIHDNFFEVGGHSLLATQLVSHIRESFDIELPLRAIFETPTIAGLAKTIEELRPEQEAAEADLARLLESLESLSEEDARALLQEKLELSY